MRTSTTIKVCATTWCYRRRSGAIGGSPARRRSAAWIGRRIALGVGRHVAMVETFIASFDAAPDELVLDFDATDDAVHGKQEGRFFHGYYDCYCFLPLYVFCGDQLL